VTLDEKVIAVLIVEKDISSELKDGFDKKKNSHEFINLIKNNNFLTDNLNAAILIFDKNGKLKIKNKNAVKMYEKLGFLCDIQDIHYNDIYIEPKKFEDILLDENYDETNEVCIDDLYFKIKTIHIKDDEYKVVKIIEDISDLKQKEAELVLKSVS
ncbi:hypothetical protein ACQPUZ_19930, partial [Clostridium tertium]